MVKRLQKMAEKKAAAAAVQERAIKVVTHVPLGEWFGVSAVRSNIGTITPPPPPRQRPLPWWPRSGQRHPQQWPLPLHRPRQPPQHPSPHLRPLQLLLLRLLSPKPPPQHPQPPRQQQATPQPFRP